MPKIISAFNGTDPIGDTLAKLGASMFGGNTTDNALKNEQLYALQRQNTETDNYAKLISEGGIMPTANNKLAQAMIIAAGLDPQKSAILGRMDAATSFGADDPRTANWQIAAGDPYSSTAGAFNKNLAETARNNDLQSTDRRYNVDQDVVLRKFLNSNISAADAQASKDRQYDTNMDFGAKNYATDQQLNASKYSTDVGANTDRYKHTTLSAQDEAINNWRKYNTDQTQLTERTKMTEAFDPVTGQPVFRPANELSTVQPFMSETDTKGALLRQNFDTLAEKDPFQREVLGANPSADRLGSPKNYILPGGQTIITYDGITSAKDGQPLPPGGYLGTVQGSADDAGIQKSTRAGLEDQAIANRKFNYLAQQADKLLEDPTLFGVTGTVRSLAQEAQEGVSNLGMLFKEGNPGDTVLKQAREEAARNGLNNFFPELYDPNLPATQTYWTLLAYQAAAMLGSSGRNLSDKELTQIKEMIGNPHGVMENAKTLKSKLQVLRQYVGASDEIAKDTLANGIQTETQPNVVDPNAQPMQIKGVDDYNALPPGAQYIDPNGVPRVKGQR